MVGPVCRWLTRRNLNNVIRTYIVQPNSVTIEERSARRVSTAHNRVCITGNLNELAPAFEAVHEYSSAVALACSLLTPVTHYAMLLPATALAWTSVLAGRVAIEISTAARVSSYTASTGLMEITIAGALYDMSVEKNGIIVISPKS